MTKVTHCDNVARDAITAAQTVAFYQCFPLLRNTRVVSRRGRTCVRGVMLMSGTLKLSFQAGLMHFEVGLRAKTQLNDNVMQNQSNRTLPGRQQHLLQNQSARVTGNTEQRGQRVLKYDTRTAVR